MRDFLIDPTSDEFYHKEQEQRISKSYPNISITTWIESQPFPNVILKNQIMNVSKVISRVEDRKQAIQKINELRCKMS